MKHREERSKSDGLNHIDTLSMMLDDLSTMKEPAAEAPPSINARIAQRVSSLRAQRGLTLDALATKSEVSRSMLSLVERGESSPTAAVLERIATGLDVPLASLFEDVAAPPNPLSRGKDRSAWRDPQSGYVRKNISPPNFPSPIQIVEVELPAGARVSYETGARDALIRQQIWIREGTLELSIGKVIHRLEIDDCLAMQLNEPMTFRNRTRKPARYIVVIASDRPRSARR